MSRSLFLLLAGIYSIVLALSMIFAPTAALESYGTGNIDLNHISLMQFLGVANLGFAALALLNRNAPNSVALRNSLLATALVVFGGVVLGLYNAYAMNVPYSTFFIGDTLFRLALGLAILYFYNRESKAAGANAVPV